MTIIIIILLIEQILFHCVETRIKINAINDFRKSFTIILSLNQTSNISNIVVVNLSGFQRMISNKIVK